MASLAAVLTNHGFDISSLRALPETPYGPLYALALPGGDRLATWQSLRALTSETGYWPVLIGAIQGIDHGSYYQEMWTAAQSLADQSPDPFGEGGSPAMMRWFMEVQPVLEIMESCADVSVESILAEAADLEPDAWLEERRREEPAYFDLPRETWAEAEANAEDAAANLDIWPGSQEATSIFMLVPTQHSWQVPALLKWGGVNRCPPPALQVAIAHEWQDRWGAELVAIASDSVEYVPSRPPQDPESAVRLAWQQFLYCPDLLFQGMSTGTLEGWAAILGKVNTWSFWWD